MTREEIIEFIKTNLKVTLDYGYTPGQISLQDVTVRARLMLDDEIISEDSVRYRTDQVCHKKLPK